MSTSSTGTVLFLGASVRAAAFAALRAGLRPVCIDLFGDTDLRTRPEVHTISTSDYPTGLSQMAAQAPVGPWLYTGGLENYPRLIDQIARTRLLWGNDAVTLRRVRSPLHLAECLRTAGVPTPRIHINLADVPESGMWLLKPIQGSGGCGIRVWNPNDSPGPTRSYYFQEFIQGEPYSAVYLGTANGTAVLVGVSRQLIGVDWLHAGAFCYCGSIGPLPVAPTTHQFLMRAGAVLTAEPMNVRGLFGIDFILRESVPYPVEVNPRYTASMELFDYALGVQTLVGHRAAFDPTAPPFNYPAKRPDGVIGKAIFFAPCSFTFPGDGPWRITINRPKPIDELPDFADIPVAGSAIEAGWPVLSFFTKAATEAECFVRLQQIARDLDQTLFER